ncbi:hypothetical protein DICVIV_03170 [Dictyocaulus viviparus]|uniref:Uncharacterized protein n=1 Tax=Dictyocaulus viviparus TaxID=29172 RepID=A0A0D8Y1T7_DICVI|nr:hypothetical protein DICVIV_03170 [Dictyocaulus viviparus]
MDGLENDVTKTSNTPIENVVREVLNRNVRSTEDIAPNITMDDTMEDMENVSSSSSSSPMLTEPLSTSSITLTSETNEGTTIAETTISSTTESFTPQTNDNIADVLSKIFSKNLNSKSIAAKDPRGATKSVASKIDQQKTVKTPQTKESTSTSSVDKTSKTMGKK